MKCSDLNALYPPTEIDWIEENHEYDDWPDTQVYDIYTVFDKRGFSWAIFMPPTTVLVGPEQLA